MKKRDKKFKDILDLLILGKTNDEIAEVLGYASITIKQDIAFLLKKYKVKNRVQLAIEYFAEKQINF